MSDLNPGIKDILKNGNAYRLLVLKRDEGIRMGA